jgi:hypothetical protein
MNDAGALGVIGSGPAGAQGVVQATGSAVWSMEYGAADNCRELWSFGPVCRSRGHGGPWGLFLDATPVVQGDHGCTISAEKHCVHKHARRPLCKLDLTDTGLCVATERKPGKFSYSSCS